MNPEEMNISLNELNHHGILGMKWGIRRFQKYPAGYSGDGKYVGPDGQPRQPTRKEARRDRKYNELKAKIDKWLVDSVETGDKKTLKRLKGTMTPQQYQSAYDALVKKGVQDAVKTGDKASLKKYKDDISKNEYKDAKTLADFNDAVNNLDTDRMNKLVSKIKNEDIKESAQRIAAITEFQNKKISALKVESETSAKLAKVATTVTNVANIASSAKKVYDVVTGIQDANEKRRRENIKYAEELKEKQENKKIEKVIKSGDEKAFEKIKDKMTNQQIEDFKKRVFLNNEAEINKGILTGDAKTKEKWAEYLSRAQVETLNKATTKDKHNNEGGAKGIKGEVIGKSEKIQNDLVNDWDSKEVASNKEKFKDLSSKIRKENDAGNRVDSSVVDALEAYKTLSFPNSYSKNELEKAAKTIKAFESSGSNIKAMEALVTAPITKSTSAEEIKNILDARVNVIFSGDTSVSADYKKDRLGLSYALSEIPKHKKPNL